MRLSIYNLNKYIEDFKNLVNENKLEKDNIDFETAKNLYAKTFGFDSFLELDLFIFKNSVSSGLLKDEDFHREVNLNYDRSKWCIETQYASLEDIDNQTFELIKIALNNDPNEIFDVKKLNDEVVFYALDRDFLLGHFPPLENRQDKTHLENEVFNDFLKPLFEKIVKDEISLENETIIKALRYFYNYNTNIYNLITEEMKTDEVTTEAIKLDGLNYLDAREEQKTFENLKLAVSQNRYILSHIEHTPEIIEYAFSVDVFSFGMFSREEQTLERAKIYIEKYGYRFLDKVKRQSEELIEFALELDDNAAAFCSPHFFKKMELEKRYYVNRGHNARKLKD